MLCWRFTIHSICCVGGLPYIAYVVLEVYHI